VATDLILKGMLLKGCVKAASSRARASAPCRVRAVDAKLVRQG